MHTDARTLENNTLIEADLCIIGAGAAGICMAMEWKDTAHKVVLLEGGGFDPSFEMQQFYCGESLGAPYQVPLEFARLHYFGGTTGHWAGWCSPLDPIDFEKRDWIPYSGWPFKKKALDPFYARAHPYVELGPYEYDAVHYEATLEGFERLPLDSEVFWTKMWQFSPPTRFGVKYRDPIKKADNIRLLTHARATEVKANDTVSSIEEIEVQTLNDKTHRVRAKHYVLACGAIQNARLLLASNKQNKAGVGNDNDVVGRFFMEHFEMGGAQLLLREQSPMKMYLGRMGGGLLPGGELAVTDLVQEKHQILNGTASLRPGMFDKKLTSFFERFTERKRVWEMEDGGRRPLVFPAAPPEGYKAFKLHSRAEQAPNPHSRVELSEEVDAMGMPLANLHWQLCELDKRSIRIFYELLGQEMGRLDIGRIQLLDWLFDDDHNWPSFLGGGFHHMGTTRMHDDPKQGVLDTNSTVHGIHNLHVAGSSTFTTAGAANPTLTLLALAIRLADHLKSKV
ncbi:MAG: GMC family oxidoreductase [Bacteroidota bacterium]